MAKNTKGTAPKTGTGISSGTATATAPRPIITKMPQVTPSVRSTASNTVVTPTYEQISERAREIWMKNGCPAGQDEQNWLDAEKQLKAELAGN